MRGQRRASRLLSLELGCFFGAWSLEFGACCLGSCIRYARTVLQRLVEQLTRGHALSDEQVTVAVGHLVGEQASVASKADFLAALASTGETIGEIAAFVRDLRARSVHPPLDP